jgi:hypothetical protein
MTLLFRIQAFRHEGFTQLLTSSGRCYVRFRCLGINVSGLSPLLRLSAISSHYYYYYYYYYCYYYYYYYYVCFYFSFLHVLSL